MNGVVGSAVSRKDGYLKVTGKARYAADHPMGNVAHAVAICSTVANGQITNIDSSAAEKSPGFLAILHHGNVPKLFRPVNNFMSASKPGEIRVVFEDDRIHYYGQYIALVVADTLQQAQHAASLVRITYKTEKPVVETEQAKHTVYDPAEFFGEKLKAERGKPAARFKDSPVTHEADYFTPTEHHNPMEPCASMAAWDGDEVTLWETTQWVAGARNTIAETLGISNERVHIISPFIGGGFGCKGFIWPHSVMSAIAAKKLGRPVKLSLTRKQMFSGAGHRSETWQRIRLGATKEGKLTAIQHETTVQTSTIDEFVEACGTTTRFLYSCENVGIAHHAVRVNIATPTPMRAPGENPGLFALESALDELAYKLNIEPVRLRIINHSDKNEHTNQPWSSKYLKECYELAGEKFGWARRDPHPRSMRDGKYLVGWGMASATYPGMRSPGAAKVRILQDGSAQVVSATQDMGGGTYTTMTQIVSDVTGIPVERIHPALGDSHLPPAPVSGGSMTTASVLPAVQQAATEALKKLVQLAIADEKSSLHGKKEDEVVAAKGKVYVKGSAPESGISYQQVLSASNQAAAEGESFMQPGKERETYAFQSWGAQFVEVKVDPEIAKVKVSRVVSAFDIGRVINRKTAESQAYSGIIMGIGMALMEHTVYDHRDGGIINSNLADYAMPVNADVNSIEVHFIDKPDPYIDSLIGARGVGEITVTGVAPAIANAIFHATGQRMRELPITPDKLL
ncbi:MAG TPA: xanthine dehydrogenase family protein molybdopterin-binding subunit [Candidatus Angelobacter sp.]|jgi:xanthine dehydrogenase YagR molybdenum-binding subunit|nr:xanthine dehydrogenase family protein molybdopterin-binding subunit [Candidatus Angelobacter sp.]